MLALAIPVRGAAQIQPEARLDAFGPAPFTIEPGLGVNLFLGNYVRLGAAAGYNVRQHRDIPGDAWHGDVLARVALDPFRQKRWGLSVGGGLAYRPRVVRLAVILDLEGPAMGHVLPALQVGMSGGFRAGLVLRRAVQRRR